MAVAGFALLASCGASTRMVHQSAYYFERCHAADLDGQRTVDERQACWAAWLRHWSGAQPPVRVRYAEQRLAALSRGEAMAPLPQNEGSGAVGLADEPMGGTQVLVDASGGAGPPQIELTPGPDAEPTTQLEASVATGTGGTAETAETAAAPVAPSGVGEEAEVSAEAPNGYTPPRPAPPPPPVRDPVPPPPPRPPHPRGRPTLHGPVQPTLGHVRPGLRSPRGPLPDRLPQRVPRLHGRLPMSPESRGSRKSRAFAPPALSGP